MEIFLGVLLSLAVVGMVLALKRPPASSSPRSSKGRRTQGMAAGFAPGLVGGSFPDDGRGSHQSGHDSFSHGHDGQDSGGGAGGDALGGGGDGGCGGGDGG